jgi:hypothetical protein
MQQIPEKRIIQGILRMGFIALLAILYMVVIPLHHHEDLVEHADCILCQLSYMASTVVTVSICLTVLAALEVVFLQITTCYIKSFTSFSLSRAPPVA